MAKICSLPLYVGKSQLEEITRDDLGAWIEHEQDRGMQASTVKMRLCDALAPEVLSKRMLIMVPDVL
jgi:hypothetical protein